MWDGLYRLFNETLFILSQSETNGSRDAEQIGHDLNRLYEMVGELSKDERFFALESRPAFGHLVFVMLGIFGDAKRSAFIRLKAASVLRLLLRDEVSDALAIVLPGYFMRLQSTALSSVNTAVASEICVMAVEMIRQLLCITLSTAKIAAKSTEIDGTKAGQTNSPLVVERDEKWLKIAGANLEPQIFLLVSRLCANSNAQIRSSTLRLLSELATKCRDTFSTKLTVDALLDVCVTMWTDADESIATDARRLLDEWRRGGDDTPVDRHLVNKLMKALKNFAKTLHDSANGFDVFQSLLNCIEALGGEAFERLTVTSTSFFDKFLAEILMSIRVDMSRLLVSTTNEKAAVFTGQGFFLGFYGEILLRSGLRFAQIWRLVENMRSSTRLIDQMLNDLVNKFGTFGAEDRIAAIVVLTALTAVIETNGAADNEGALLVIASLRSVVAFALSTVSELADQLRDDVDDKQIDSFRLSTAHSSSTVLLSALLYVIGVDIAQLAALTPDLSLVEELRVNAIYELLKWLPSGNPLIRRAALCAIECMADSYTVGAFLRFHAAAIVFKASLESRDFSSAGRTVPLVLTELLERADPHPSSSAAAIAGGDGTDELFDATRYIVEGLLDVLDRSDQKSIKLILRSVRSYVHAVSRWYPDLRPLRSTVVGTALDELSDEERENIDEDATKIAVAMENQRADASADFPPIRSVVGVLNRTKHMISSQHLPIQRLVLDVLDTSLSIVRHFEDELLPMIHQNWQGLVCKFGGPMLTSPSSAGDERRIVAVNAIQVVVTMCRLSKGFVYQKVANELMPQICTFMAGTVVIFDRCSKSTLNFYHQTAVYRLQLSIIEYIPAITDDCDLSAEHIKPFVDVMRKYAVLSPEFKSQGVETLRGAATAAVNHILSRYK